jgi:hypothetical protein
LIIKLKQSSIKVEGLSGVVDNQGNFNPLLYQEIERFRGENKTVVQWKIWIDRFSKQDCLTNRQ